MKRPKIRRIVLGIVAALLVAAVGGILIYDRGRPVPVPIKENLYEGVTYTRRVRWSPRALVIHVITVDMRTNGLRFLVTPPDEKDSPNPLRARTTTQFMQEFGVQIAINGDAFSPWWSRSPADYYPHVGDPVHPHGDTASRGRVYWTTDAALPTLYISSRNQLSFDAPAKLYNAISGQQMLVTGGNALPDLNDRALQPRTAIGYSSNGRFLYLVVVDGRQPLYGEGMTLQELADFMISLGAHYAMSMDGGGSSTMVVQGRNGQPSIMNSPIDNYIPGRERPVANHLGIYVRAGK